MLPARRALISVFDKRGLTHLARGLAQLGVELVSTGGTLKFLAEEGIPVTKVSDVTGFPEILEGRVKTLHPHIHAGILARRSEATHTAEIAEHGITPIDLVVVNLYPFRETVASGAKPQQVIEMIDIGGPAMLRAAAKNFEGVGVVVDPVDYPEILAALEAGGGVLPEDLRRRLAAKAFHHTHTYDAAIAEWLTLTEAAAPRPDDLFPAHLGLRLERELTPRYGENPHQQAAVYRLAAGDGVLGGFQQLGGKELSWNNLLDADAARKIAGLFAEPAVVIVKHNNPCGVGRGETLAKAYLRALATDPISAFGGIIALNRPADAAFAEAVAELFVEVLVAPGFEDAALARLASKKALRLLECPVYRPAVGASGAPEIEFRSVDGGFLAQTADALPDDPSPWTCPTKRQPTEAERRALELAWAVARYVKSNAIVLTTADQTVGIGAGQMSRVDSCRLAVQKAVLPTAGT
ncbi:MAG TPA: bifunctional phosphoribosylaminoimidazolecarboxamide formyltransferase/IMP cyclohydrolase, partial [Thermoanaerobaculia bacterium]|nr:bifunctional phosphoribosylaminoimidazolecarboxamide formyltransferase/IMP cyclohydrolase [Thermoanaerobaculia bacterium]